MIRERSKQIQDFILQNVTDHPSDIGKVASKRFDISRQAINKHIKRLIAGKKLKAEGSTKSRSYSLLPIIDEMFEIVVKEGIEEDTIWRNKIMPLFKDIPENVIGICGYGFSEMVNNVLDHSETKKFIILVTITYATIELSIRDVGIGIFNKLKRDLGFDDTRQAFLELAKGKLTTDPKRHSGEGIFFTSRMFDTFTIMSGSFFFSSSDGDWLIEDRTMDQSGTAIIMEISTKSNKTTKELFDRFTTDFDNYGFTKTHVPVRLAQYEGETLVSRSQAKRLLIRFEKFKEVMLDFKGIKSIGQAFADEIFRVFQNDHPEIRIVYENVNKEVEQMISRALHHE